MRLRPHLGNHQTEANLDFPGGGSPQGHLSMSPPPGDMQTLARKVGTVTDRPHTARPWGVHEEVRRSSELPGPPAEHSQSVQEQADLCGPSPAHSLSLGRGKDVWLDWCHVSHKKAHAQRFQSCLCGSQLRADLAEVAVRAHLPVWLPPKQAERVCADLRAEPTDGQAAHSWQTGGSEKVSW